MGKRSWIGPAWRGCWPGTRGSERSLFFAGSNVAGGPGIGFVPLWGFGAVRNAEDAQRHRAIHLGHVVVVELGPLVTGAVIVREDVTDRKRGAWNTGVGKGGVVAAGEKRIAVLLVLHHANAGSLAGLAQESGDVGVVETRHIELAQERPL